MPTLDTLSWYSLSIPLYGAFLALEWALGRRESRAVFSFNETISNLTAGLGTMLLGIFAGPWVLRAWDWTHAHLAPLRWPSQGLWRYPAALVLADFCYYAYHRAGHRLAVFWAIHGIHHQHEHLNSTVGFRLEWFADPYAALFFGLMPLAGVDSSTGFTAIAALSVYALLAHCPVFRWPSLGLLVTPAVHGAHHSRDARYAGKNFSAMLAVWDRLLGTWSEPPAGEELRRDVPSVARTHDGVSAQWGLVVELAQRLRASGSVASALRTLTSEPVLRSAPEPRDDHSVPRAVRAHVLPQFLGLAVVAAWLLWFRGERAVLVTLSAMAAVLLGLHSLGALLDGRPGAEARERLRLLATALVGAALLGSAPFAGLALLAAAVLGLAASPLRTPRTAP
ncbi:MAG: sterol desaturase family protein [Deltaproteobacteria bacterium]|nr:sterol desaturase family protein [Deltaproteobacteria bacterium]